MNKKRIICLVMAAVVLLAAAMIVPNVIVNNGGNNDTNNGTNNGGGVNGGNGDNAVNVEQVDFSTVFGGKVNQWSQTLGVVERKIPTETSNEGLCTRYPTYGTSIPDITDEEKDALLAETALLFASTTTYDSMDSDGNYILDGQLTGKKLYKHTSAVGMYYGDVSDSEQAVRERVTIVTNEQRNYVTGLYAPAGEVVKIEISQQDLDAIGGSLTVVVGQVSHRNNINNIWKARNDFNRMPIVANVMKITSTEAYVGNPLGGPVYVYPSTFGSKFSVTISGAVKYAHYIHGQTTREDVEEMKSYSAPYYDFEVWDMGVRLSGTSNYGNYDYDNLVKVGNLWEKIVRTSRQVPCSANATIGVGFVFDCFVAAGAACAFQGGHSWVNAPCSWLPGSLDYQSMVTDGFWGQIHEFNHLYQSYGMESSKTNEVTNNATSLLSYVSYTQISSKRSINDSSLGNDWNRYTDASRSLKETLSASKSGKAQQALNAYADIIHAFGTDVFTQATRVQNGFGVDAWYEALSLVTDYNFTYYFEQLLCQTLSDEVKAKYDTADRIPFVPVATVFQTGRSVYVDGKETFVSTMQPYRIERGKAFDVDLAQYLVVPDGFDWQVKSVSAPQSGTFVKLSDKLYRYTPSTQDLSGEIKVVVSLQHDSIATKDVTLTLNFRQYDKNQVNVYKYTYGGDVTYQTVDDAVANGFEGYTNVDAYTSNSTFVNGLANGQIGVVEGKIYIETSGTYAFCLRSGRGNNTLYLSVNDNDNLQQVLSLNTDHGGFALDGEHVVTLQLNAGDYVYFREITLSRHYQDAFTELGFANLDQDVPVMRTVPTKLLCTNDMQMPVFDFSSEEKYPNVYQAGVLYESISKHHTLVDVNMGSWSDTEDIANLFDDDESNYYHNPRNNFVSQDNPFVLTADIGSAGVYNKLTLVSRTSNQYNLPCTFQLFTSLDGQDWTLAGQFVDVALQGNKVAVNFDTRQMRFYRLVVTDTKSQNNGNKYVTLCSVNFAYQFEGVELSPFVLQYFKTDKTNFVSVDQPSSFGSLVVGNGNAKYSFEGKAFALAVWQQQQCSVRITIDGKSTVVDLQSDNTKQYAFVVTDLNDGKHSVELEVLSGTLSVDSVLAG